MKRITNALSLVLFGLLATTISAGEIAPNDVKFDGLSVNESLTGVAGDVDSGRKIFVNKKQGNCLACHVNSDLKDQQFHGEIGPSLDGVSSRWQEAQLRTILVNAKAVFTEQTVMPGFYTLKVGADVREDLIGKTILSAQQVEDLVAYLMTLK